MYESLATAIKLTTAELEQRQTTEAIGVRKK